ncbi:hypothetical protein GGS23DRAFT_135126 [Durotheca rogersii]|uniref:uncharacterized protein n=1 Tax=Durotheca rogersii TaxID=419775 RepID=UPI00221EF5DE|nr:uncharacterized protein GGS23DRAFT_135126 [Durotheca rogersii]KAI5861852.1 hypothetical protein GGS23DRAFT_135126 [Durotheca rogersii]
MQFHPRRPRLNWTCLTAIIVLPRKSIGRSIYWDPALHSPRYFPNSWNAVSAVCSARCSHSTIHSNTIYVLVPRRGGWPPQIGWPESSSAFVGTITYFSGHDRLWRQRHQAYKYLVTQTSATTRSFPAFCDSSCSPSAASRVVESHPLVCPSIHHTRMYVVADPTSPMLGDWL